MSQDVIFFMDIGETLPTIHDNRWDSEGHPDRSETAYFNARADELIRRGLNPRLVLVSGMRKDFSRKFADEWFGKVFGITVPFHDDWRVSPDIENTGEAVTDWRARNPHAAYVIMDDTNHYTEAGLLNFVQIPRYPDTAERKGFKLPQVDAAFVLVDAQLVAPHRAVLAGIPEKLASPER